MSKLAIKNNRILRSQQVLSVLIAIVRPYLPLGLPNARIAADGIGYGLNNPSSIQIQVDIVFVV